MVGLPVRGLALALLVVLAGCAAPTTGPAPPAAESGADEVGPDADELDTDADDLGTVDGYRYDDSIEVDASDGLDDAELDAVVARTMARVEHIRGLQFERSVPVEVITREEFRERGVGGETDHRYATWNNQVWRALLVVDGETDVEDAFDAVYGSSVLGFYTAEDGGKIVLVSDSPTPTVDRTTLAHELVHALQDQRFGLGPRGNTQDEQLAVNGLIEGEANYVQQRYEERCADDWDCVEKPSRASSGTVGGFNRALFLTVYQPYSDGPAFVSSLRERGGWERVDRALAEERPASTEQVVHPERYPDVEPEPVTVPDRSGENWSRFTDLPGDRDPTDTVGEVSLFAMLYAQDVVPNSHLHTADDGSTYNYSHPATDGWAGDAVVPYRDGDGEYGYVLKTAWKTERDATEFREAHERALNNMGAEERSPGVYRVPDEQSFDGAYRVEQRGRSVVVVNAPTVAALDAVHAPESAALDAVHAQQPAALDDVHAPRSATADDVDARESATAARPLPAGAVA